ncbi:glycosyltransferase [Agromyces sp. Leaf222]|uniref:glycosyltransferase n=1 Tax=Agromyces sp. Leaf222 TaxID=1735688 RepID=UPI0012F872C7|nr:glycosyltransferase [Agromyces sp. Leaf222]
MAHSLGDQERLGRPRRTPRVSVVVATYSPGAGLDRLVASLDAQTLPADEFEVIFVDDGSPDDTADRLQAIASTRPNVRVERIENSGWASRPRNVGADLATGEYVLFMDHDDELYPDALRAAAAFAGASGADVLNGKEARTQDAGWALDTYRGDRPQDVGRADAHPLVPMNPHKLYRTGFLRQHGIRFPEGRRVLWEDIRFNVEVAEHARTISTLSSVPFYHWVQTAGSGSTTFVRSDPAWWDHLGRVLEDIDARLGHDSLQGRQLRRHQYTSRILGSFSPAFLRRPAAERRLIEHRARLLQQRFTDAADDRALDRGACAVAAALRSGDTALLELAASTAGTDRFGAPVLESARWHEGRLLLAATIATTDRLPGGGTFRVVDGRLLAASAELLEGLAATRAGDDPSAPSDLPAEVDLGPEYDVAAELDATTAAFTVRGRTSRLPWLTGGEITRRGSLGHADGSEARYELSIEGAVDARRAGADLEHALDDEVWDAFLRVNRVGRVQQPRVRSDSAIRALPALIDGRPAIAYTNRDGNLSIDLGGAVASIFDAATPTRSVAYAAAPDGGVIVQLELHGVAVHGDADGRGWVLLSYRRAGLRSEVVGLARRVARREHPPTRHPAHFRPNGTGVIAALHLPGPGRYRWEPSPRDPAATAWTLTVGRDDAKVEIRRG